MPNGPKPTTPSKPLHHHFTPPVTTVRARDLRREMTVPERILWGMLRNGRLGGFKFRRQHPIGKFVADFACIEAMLVVELDGMSHDGRGDADDRRTKEIEQYGCRVIRFTNDEALQDQWEVAETILEVARDRRNPAIQPSPGSKTRHPLPGAAGAAGRGGEKARYSRRRPAPRTPRSAL